MPRKLSEGATTTTRVTTGFSSIVNTSYTLCSEPNVSTRIETIPSSTELSSTRRSYLAGSKRLNRVAAPYRGQLSPRATTPQTQTPSPTIQLTNRPLRYPIIDSSRHDKSLRSTQSFPSRKSRLLSLFNICRDPCLFGSVTEQITLVSKDDLIPEKHSFDKKQIIPKSDNILTPPNHRCEQQPSTDDIVKLVTSAVLAILEERDLLTSQSALKASFGDSSRVEVDASPLLFPLPSSPSPAHAERPRTVSTKSSSKGGDGEEDLGSAQLEVDTENATPLFTSDPIRVPKTGTSPTEKAAKIIFRLVTEVSTELSQDDKARIRSKFSSSKSNRSLSIGVNPRVPHVRASHHMRSSSYARISAWG